MSNQLNTVSRLDLKPTFSVQCVLQMKSKRSKSSRSQQNQMNQEVKRATKLYIQPKYRYLKFKEQKKKRITQQLLRLLSTQS